MADIGMPGIILLIVVALLLFGPKKLPELGRALGRTVREFKSGARGILDEEDTRKQAAADLEPEENQSKKQLPE